jgi:hypothetical protein
MILSNIRSYAKTTPEQRAEQQAECLKLKLAGWRQDQIAEQLGLPEQTVSMRIKKALNSMVQPAAEELRKEEIARLDKYLKALDEVIEHGAVTHDQKGNSYVDEAKRSQAISTAVRVAERRAKLLGIDMPQQIDVKHEHIGSVEAEIAKLAAELALNVTASDESEIENA